MLNILSLRNIIFTLGFFIMTVSHGATAGGIMLGGTRVIYPAGARQVMLPIKNTSDASSFLVQSWVEDSTGNKSDSFIVSPPIYVSGPGNENTLRLIYTGAKPVEDRETLYYFNSKAIPSVDKEKIENENILLLASITRIKMFMRPAGLKMSVNDAPGKITFHHEGKGVRIENPTPYYMTLAKMKAGNKTMPDTMVAPFSSQSVAVNISAGSTVSYRSLNDFGALTPQINTQIK